jgi:23S rRNA pseudouridine955/2504/2580 synthase
MKEIPVTKDIAQQRVDRYLKKYLDRATLSFIYKMIRKKNITVNGKKVSEDYFLEEGDLLQLFLSDETIEKFQTKKEKRRAKTRLNIVYEDDNILVINKPAGLLSHSTRKGRFEKNVVDSVIEYLIDKGEYIPRQQITFTPSIINRLDRNTSGIIIAAKNYLTLQTLNQAMREQKIKKYYYTIVRGVVKGQRDERAFLSKIESKRNRVKINQSEGDEKEIQTIFRDMKGNADYTFLEIDLVTGRTHQIRAHLAHLKLPIIGDRKYGKPAVNQLFSEKYQVENQLLHCGAMSLSGMEGDLAYLNGRRFEAKLPKTMNKIIQDLFKE